MLRVALLTADPALWSHLWTIVHAQGGCVIDLLTLRQASVKNWRTVDCDAVVLDARVGEGESIWHPLRARWNTPTIALIEHGQASLLPTFLGQSSRHELAFLNAGEAPVLDAVRSFLARQPVDVDPAWAWGKYVFEPLHSGVTIAGQHREPMSPHKFRFAMSLFLHRNVSIPWARLHRLAWGDRWPARAATAMAHAGWMQDVLELDGEHDHLLEVTDTHCTLRGTPSSRATRPVEGRQPAHSRDLVDTTPGGL